MMRLLSGFSLKYQVGSLALLGIIGLMVFGAIYFVGDRRVSSWLE